MSLSSRPAPRFHCTSCGDTPERWSARCHCGGWISQSGDFARVVKPTRAARATQGGATPPTPRPEEPRAARAREAEDAEIEATTAAEPRVAARPAPDLESELISLTEIPMVHLPKFTTGIEPLDRVIGGGFALGGSFLVSGDPGAGKSTLLSQTLFHVRRPDGSPCERLMWASAEETTAQIATRAHRIGAAHAKIHIARGSDVDRILALAGKFRPEMLVVDSIHTISTDAVGGAVGSLLQVKECAVRLDHFSKDTGAVVLLICHVTKDGQSAGPNTLRHLVDALLSLEIGECERLRYLRMTKNRFGSANEIGCFEMRAEGLCPVAMPEPRDDDEGVRNDEMHPIAQELVYRLLDAGLAIDDGLRDRIAGRLDLVPRGAG